MAKVYINKWSGGMKNDSRESGEDICRVSTNFDTITNPTRLTPYFSSESGDTAASTSQKQNFQIALRTGTTYRLYALGRQVALNRAEVLMKDLTAGGSTDLGDDGWSTPANNQSSVASPFFDLFIYYKKTGLIYGAEAGTTIWTFDPSSSAAWGSASHSISYTTVAQGLVHSKDDRLYIPYDNKIAINNNGSWTDAALTLPSHFVINSISEYGNYLAIGCAPLSGLGNSVVYLWDRDSTFATLSESIDWGEGNLKVLEELEGVLVGISVFGGNSTSSSSKIVFKYYAGSSGAVKFEEFIVSSTTISLLRVKQKLNSRLYFMASVSISGTTREGVWSVTKSPLNGSFSINHERTPNNGTALVNGTLNGFFIVGDFVFISYQTNSAFALSKTTEGGSTYSSTYIRETTKNPNMEVSDTFKLKQLTAVALFYESLSGSVTLYYKVDGGSWINIFTDTTSGAVVTERIKTDSGTEFTKGREYEFKIETTGGTNITKLFYSYNPFPSLI